MYGDFTALFGSACVWPDNWQFGAWIFQFDE
jgi:hypothetical protein